MPKSKLPNLLLLRCRAWAGNLTKVAKALAPHHLKDLIHSHVEPDHESAKYTIRIAVSYKPTTNYKYGSADARAQEYGSGEHAQFGTKGKYTILPRAGKKYLAFKWQVATENPNKFWIDKEGRVHLESVQHPGIEAVNEGEGYVRPAVKELRARLKEELDPVIREALNFDMRGAFKHASKK